jgi:uncharacterized membrane protein YheB (UPF0754 family)
MTRLSLRVNNKMVSLSTAEIEKKPTSIFNILSIISFIATLLGLGIGIFQLIYAINSGA